MAAEGPASQDSEFESCVGRGEITVALQAIWENRDRKHAQMQFSFMLEQLNPQQWQAYLTDPKIEEYQELFTNEQLQKLLAHIFLSQRQYSKGDPKLEVLHQLAVTIAKNPYFCQSLSYGWFIKYVTFNPLLAEYVTTTPEFLMKLDYSLVEKLALLLPDHFEKILDTIFKSITLYSDCIDWATYSVRRIFLLQLAANPSPKDAFELIFTLPKYDNFLRLIRSEFDVDPDFAQMVLQHPVLCRLWSETGEMCAFKHPLLDDINFAFLGCLYRESHPEVSNAYFSYCLDPLAALQMNQPKEIPAQALGKIDDNEDVMLEGYEFESATVSILAVTEPPPTVQQAFLIEAPTFTPLLTGFAALDISAESTRDALFEDEAPVRPRTPAFGRPSD